MEVSQEAVKVLEEMAMIANVQQIQIGAFFLIAPFQVVKIIPVVARFGRVFVTECVSNITHPRLSALPLLVGLFLSYSTNNRF